MLEIDTKREIITGEFARKTWSEVLAMWLKARTVQAEEINQQYKVEGKTAILRFIMMCCISEY